VTNDSNSSYVKYLARVGHTFSLSIESAPVKHFSDIMTLRIVNFLIVSQQLYL